jgi:hypothetical protein
LAFLSILFLSAIVLSAELVSYDTRYYIIHTDLDETDAREAAIRMTKMAEEYHARTRDFSGDIRQRMSFYLFKQPADYYANGGVRGSAGYFKSGTNELVAMAGDLGPSTWHIVQHEGFHQFAHFVIRGDLPVWLNEGLAEYFGEALFTGDGFVSGVIPQWRLKRIRASFAERKFKPLSEMMNLSLEEWNSKLAIANYDQGWSMVQFLAHGENGRYQRAFGAFMGLIGSGQPWQDAWARTFGDTTGFEERWREYWTKLPDDPTADLYTKANVATWTSYLARAASQKQTFPTFEDLRLAAGKGQLKHHPDDWLPPALLAEAMHNTEQFLKDGYTYKLAMPRPPDRSGPQLVCSMPHGNRVVGKFAVRGGRAGLVTTDLVAPASTTTRGK